MTLLWYQGSLTDILALLLFSLSGRGQLYHGMINIVHESSLLTLTPGSFFASGSDDNRVRCCLHHKGVDAQQYSLASIKKVGLEPMPVWIEVFLPFINVKEPRACWL
jgi:hypothetical protein